MLRLADNPLIRFPEDVGLGEVPGRWFVAHTKSRREKVLANLLLARESAYFLPMVEKVTVIRGRKFKALLPLFPGYAFFAGDASTRSWVMQTGHVARVLTVLDQEQLLDELSQIDRALARGAELDPFPFARQGSRCQVRCGPFAGLTGIVLERRKVTRLILQVETLGQAVAIEIDTSLLEPVN